MTEVEGSTMSLEPNAAQAEPVQEASEVGVHGAETSHREEAVEQNAQDGEVVGAADGEGQPPEISKRFTEKLNAAFVADVFARQIQMQKIKEGHWKDSSELEAEEAAVGFLASATAEEEDKEFTRSVKWKSRLDVPPEEAATSMILETLSSSPLFEGCSDNMLSKVCDLASRFSLEPGEQMTLKDNGELYIIEDGSVQSCVGRGPEIKCGPGSLFNQVGMLGLYREAEIFKPRITTIKSVFHRAHVDILTPYEVLGYSGPSPHIFNEREEAEYIRPDLRCLYNLCPHACANLDKKHDESKGSLKGALSGQLRKNTGWLRFTVTGANNETGRPTRIMCIRLALWEEIRKKHVSMTEVDVEMRKSVDRFRENCKNAVDRWQCLMKNCLNEIFPSVPPEVMWFIAEISRNVVVESGHTLVNEGAFGDDAESLVVIREGSGVVEKLIGSSGSAVPTAVGRIRPGAIIGDLCYLGAAHVRAATVRAKADLEAIVLPAPQLLGVVTKFPGMLEHIEPRMIAATEFFKQQLPSRQEVLTSMRLFSCCDTKFLTQLAGTSYRKTFKCGQVVIDENSQQGSLYVLEYGTCSVEKKGEGRIADITLGHCVGERTLLGMSEKANATVRVLTVAALMCVVPKDALVKTLEWYPSEAKRFERIKTQHVAGQQKGGQVQHVELFSECSPEFCDFLSDSVTIKGYMPGQTIVVQGANDEPNMFVIMGGTVAVESLGNVITELSAGATFGELVMLDLAHHRSCTIRAQTFCLLSEIPRAGFSAALEKHPDHLDLFKGVNEKRTTVVWPCLKSAPDRLLYLLDLYAEQRICRLPNEKWVVNESAILVIKGEVEVRDEFGNEWDRLQAGQCLNQHFMLGIRDGCLHTILKPNTDCKVRLVSKAIWDKVMAEFPQEENSCKNQVLKYSASTAEEMLSLQPGVGESLRLSAVFRVLSSEFVLACQKVIQSRFYTTGHTIIAPRQEEHGIYVVLNGQVSVEDRKHQHKSAVGRVFGESILLGISNVYAYTVEAVTLCTVVVLLKSDFEDLIEESPDDCRMISHLEHESRAHARGDKKLQEGIHKCATFSDASTEFATFLASEMEDVFYAPNEIVFSYGEECVFGESPFYLLLAGQVYVESKLGVRLGSIKAVEVFGESAVPGIGGKRTATIMAWEKGLVHCGRIPGPSMERAFRNFPVERDRLLSLFENRQQGNEKIEQTRRKWLKETAMPALQQQKLFEGCLTQFLWCLATPLQETSYKPGKVIARVGDTAHSMFVVLEGHVALETKTGTRIGVISSEAAVGELAMFGLLPTLTATLRAVSQDTRILEVTSLALRHALSTRYAGGIGERFKKFIRCRQEQVALGAPLAYLNIGTVPGDVSVSAVAIHARRLFFESGEVMKPIPDTDPHGPHFVIVASGRAQVEMENKRKVMTLTAGSIVHEGIVAEFRAVVRSMSTVCEVYQLRQNDFKIATSTVSSSSKWVWQFNLREKECKRELLTRLQNMNGLIEGLAPHPSDEEIKAWRNQRQISIRLANERRGGYDVGTKLPLIPKNHQEIDAHLLARRLSHEKLAEHAEHVSDETHMFLSAISKKRNSSLEWTAGQSLASDKVTKNSHRVEEHAVFGSGLVAYPSFHLPLIPQDSSPTKGGKGVPRSQSETSLRRPRDKTAEFAQIDSF